MNRIIQAVYLAQALFVLQIGPGHELELILTNILEFWTLDRTLIKPELFNLIDNILEYNLE